MIARSVQFWLFTAPAAMSVVYVGHQLMRKSSSGPGVSGVPTAPAPSENPRSNEGVAVRLYHMSAFEPTRLWLKRYTPGIAGVSRVTPAPVVAVYQVP